MLHIATKKAVLLIQRLVSIIQLLKCIAMLRTMRSYRVAISSACLAEISAQDVSMLHRRQLSNISIPPPRFSCIQGTEQEHLHVDSALPAEKLY